jgi:hypothetical protein
MKDWKMSKYGGVRYYQLMGWSDAKRRSQPPSPG